MAKPILVEIFANATQFQHELDKAAGSTRRFGAVAKTLGFALAGTLALGLEESVRAAVNAQDSQRRLEQAFKNTGLSADAYSKQITDAEAASRKLGFTGNDVRDALGSLLTATKDVSLSIKDLGVAQDLARFKGIDLETATRTLTQAMTGSQRALKTLGVTISPVTTAVDALKRSHEDLSTAAGKADLAQAKLADKMATGQAVIAATTDLVKGQGQAYAETAAGGMARFHAELDNLEVIIGTKLLPALTALLTEATSLATFLSANLGPTVQQITQFLSHFEGAARLVGAYIKTEWRAIFAFWRAELAAGAAVLNGVRTALDTVRGAAVAVAGFFSGAFHAAVSAAHAVISALDSALNGVRSAFAAVRSAAGNVASFVSGGLTGALNGFHKVAGAVEAVIRAIAGALSAAASAARALAGALSSIHVPHISLPSVHGVLGGLIPGAARGFQNFSGGLAMVGERGPELVNLPRGSDVIPNHMLGGGGTIIVHHQTILDGKVIEESNRRETYRYQQRNVTTGYAT